MADDSQYLRELLKLTTAERDLARSQLIDARRAIADAIDVPPTAGTVEAARAIAEATILQRRQLEDVRKALRAPPSIPPEVPERVVPTLSDPCPGRPNGHSVYLNAGPGGKRHGKPGWQCCQACGANGPMEPAP